MEPNRWLATVAVLAFWVPTSSAQQFDVGGQVGVGRTPLSSFSSFSPRVSSSAYSRDQLGITLDAYVGLRVASHYRVQVALGRGTYDARVETSSPSQFLQLQVATIPISATVEYRFRGVLGQSTPFVGLGPSLVRSDLSASGFTAALEGNPWRPRQSWSLGAVAYIGQTASITPSLAMTARLCYRWSERSWLGNGSRMYAVQNSGTSVQLGTELRF